MATGRFTSLSPAAVDASVHPQAHTLYLHTLASLAQPSLHSLLPHTTRGWLCAFSFLLLPACPFRSAFHSPEEIVSGMGGCLSVGALETLDFTMEGRRLGPRPSPPNLDTHYFSSLALSLVWVSKNLPGSSLGPRSTPSIISLWKMGPLRGRQVCESPQCHHSSPNTRGLVEHQGLLWVLAGTVP